MKTADLLESHKDVWTAATQHPFLSAVRDGTLPSAAFFAWLIQDHYYLADLLTFQARLLARAPRPAQAVLAGGLIAIIDEMTWFERYAQQHNHSIDEPRHPVTDAYARLLRALDVAPYAAAVTALWAIESVYFHSWQHALPGAPEYRDFVAHWTVPAFAEYVAGLESAADDALAHPETDTAQAERAFIDVLRLEREFWDMAQAGGHA